MITWTKTGRIVSPEGTTTTYTGEGTDLTIESRKRNIPHAGGRPGTWEHTSFWVLRDGKEVKERYSLRDAKDYAEEINRREE